ncbi:glycosyltransferase family 4 protein [Patescibacteria group bacterium]|nr:glycosyltransferase family 4 protein [Patescibacteria group bacterium]
MNILILNWRGPKHPNAGGAEQVTLEHAKAWVKAGHEVTWFSSYFKNAKKQDVIAGVKVVRSGRQFFDVQLRAFFWYLFGDHPKFDLVVDQIHGIPFFTPLYVRQKKLAFIHEVAKEVWKLNPWPRPFNMIPAIVGLTFEPLIFRFYKKVPFMTVSESTKKDLVAWGIPKENITVIHNGVKLRLPKPLPDKEDKKTAMFLGAISKDKGIEDALKTFSEINRMENNWQFWVVGKASREYEVLIQKLAIKLGLRKNFKYWGCVSDPKKFELLARAHVLINPSIREGWGLVNIEANAVGTPVVAYNVDGIKDSVRDLVTGVLCKEKYPKCLAKEAMGLLNDSKKYAIMSSEAVKWSKKFNWKKATKESLELIDSLKK